MFPTGQSPEKFSSTLRVLSTIGWISTMTILVLATTSKLPIMEALGKPAGIGVLLVLAFMPHHFVIWRLSHEHGELKNELAEIKTKLDNS